MLDVRRCLGHACAELIGGPLSPDAAVGLGHRLVDAAETLRRYGGVIDGGAADAPMGAGVGMVPLFAPDAPPTPIPPVGP